MPKVLTVFRNRLRPEAGAEYSQMLARMRELAMATPGYLSHKTFVAEDGERCTIVEFGRARLPVSQCIPHGGAIAEAPAQPGHCKNLFEP